MYRIRLLVLAGVILMSISVFSGHERVMASPTAVPHTAGCVNMKVSAAGMRERMSWLQCEAEREAGVRAEWYEGMSHLESMAGIVYDPL